MLMSQNRPEDLSTQDTGVFRWISVLSELWVTRVLNAKRLQRTKDVQSLLSRKPGWIKCRMKPRLHCRSMESEWTPERWMYSPASVKIVTSWRPDKISYVDAIQEDAKRGNGPRESRGGEEKEEREEE